MNNRLISRLPDTQRDAPPLLFVHGAYVGGWCWAENFLPYFASQGYRAHAVDLRRHNGSRRRLGFSPHATLNDYVDQISEGIERLGEPPVLIGHSMGGYLIQQYLLQDSAAAAVLMASVPPQGLVPTTAWLAFTNPLLFHQIQLLQWFGPQTVFALYGIDGGRRPLFSPHLADDKVRQYTSRAQLESPQAIFEMSLPLGSRQDSTPPTNTLVLGAALDSLIQTAAIHSTANAFDTQAVFVPELGHAMMLDHHWRDAASTIHNWLQQQDM